MSNASMIDSAKVYDFPSLYIEIAKLKPNDKNHLMRCLRNRQRVLKKEMERRNNSPVDGAPSSLDSVGQATTLSYHTHG